MRGAVRTIWLDDWFVTLMLTSVFAGKRSSAGEHFAAPLSTFMVNSTDGMPFPPPSREGMFSAAKAAPLIRNMAATVVLRTEGRYPLMSMVADPEFMRVLSGPKT